MFVLKCDWFGIWHHPRPGSRVFSDVLCKLAMETSNKIFGKFASFHTGQNRTKMALILESVYFI